MAILKIINSEDKYCDNNTLHDILRYCQNPDKTKGYIGGWSVNPNNAYVEMTIFNRLANQDNGKRLRHYIVAFKPDTLSNQDVLYNMAKDITEFFAEEYQVVFALHFDKEHPHFHIVLNTTNVITLKKFQNNKSFFYNFRAHILQVMHYYKIKDTLCYVSMSSDDNRY